MSTLGVYTTVWYFIFWILSDCSYMHVFKINACAWKIPNHCTQARQFLLTQMTSHGDVYCCGHLIILGLELLTPPHRWFWTQKQTDRFPGLELFYYEQSWQRYKVLSLFSLANTIIRHSLQMHNFFPLLHLRIFCLKQPYLLLSLCSTLSPLLSIVTRHTLSYYYYYYY